MILVKTPLGMERIAASRITELDVNVEVEAKPYGYPGLVLVKDGSEELASKIKGEVIEAERVLLADEAVSADIDSIVSAAVKVAKHKLTGAKSFAVRTVRRGSHSFTSIDVNVKVGAAVKAELGLPVDLRNPDKMLCIEVLKDLVLIGVMEGSELHHKLGPGKHSVLPYLRKAAVVQMPYLDSLDAAREMGIRIGREVQTFEVKELVVAFIGSVKARELQAFLNGVFEGINSRFEIQRRIYAHTVHKVPVYVQDLYQLVRDRMKEPLIVFEPEGRPASTLTEELASFFTERHGRVNLLLGSREGIPSGVFRFADLVVDLCPGVTIATDLAAASALIAIASAVEEWLISHEEQKAKQAMSVS